ncbi:glyoxalase [Streptomyces sp. NPDC047706]|uniref:glyoxalase n=1 Tax=Streptomyces sp. NPDC047706 TaxID=3365486 RepID=UPI003720BA97
MALTFEVVVLPVLDVDRAKAFHEGLGSRPDVDHSDDEGFRVAHHIVAARSELQERGADMNGEFHDAGGVFHHAGEVGRVSGPGPERRSYGSFASFSDPDGNGRVLQEVTERLPGR